MESHMLPLGTFVYSMHNYVAIARNTILLVILELDLPNNSHMICIMHACRSCIHRIWLAIGCVELSSIHL